MNRSLTAVFAGLEALLVVAIGIGISLVPLTVLWGLQYGFAPDWLEFWRASVDVWLLGHGTDVSVTLDAVSAESIGLAGAAEPFPLTIAALGFGLLTVLLGVRAGRRIAETDHRALGGFTATAVFAALSLAAASSAQHPLVEPSVTQATVLPTLVFALGLLLGFGSTKRSAADDAGSSLRDWVDDWRPSTRAIVATSLRGGLAAVSMVMLVASVVTAVLIMTSYAQVITLYEGLHTGVLGGAAITIAQLAFLPNLVVWAGSWFVGPGFAIGAGSAVSPLGTTLGPLPAIPVLGAIPSGELPFAFAALLVPLLAGFITGVGFRSRLEAAYEYGDDAQPPWLLAAGAGIGLVGGAVFGLLAWMSSGSAGPGRLAVVGPDPVQVALWAAVEIGVPATLGVLIAARAPARVLPA